ncbi:MAG: hypothetical protein Q7K33_02670 [Candidatus Berkelbacteria bacterium]|nr:hypothetical protein [Candidatus Berkelbacteria bacterium]
MIIFISGSDSFLARDAIHKLKTKYLEKNPDGVELIEIDATEPMRNWADLKASPLFATSRLIIIKRAGELLVDEQNNLASMLTDLPPSSVVVIWDGKPLKAKSPLSAQLEAATKTINTEPLAGSALRSWIKSQATEIGFEVTEESVGELVDQYGSDLWGIQTDLRTRQGTSSISSWGRVQTEKPFALFDYVRGKRWSELRKHLVLSHQRGEAVEMTIGSLAAAVRKNVSDPSLKRKMTDTLSEIDIALKSGLIESGDAIALLACYLPDGQKRVQWEVAWESLT